MHSTLSTYVQIIRHNVYEDRIAKNNIGSQKLHRFVRAHRKTSNSKVQDDDSGRINFGNSTTIQLHRMPELHRYKSTPLKNLTNFTCAITHLRILIGLLLRIFVNANTLCPDSVCSDLDTISSFWSSCIVQLN